MVVSLLWKVESVKLISFWNNIVTLMRFCINTKKEKKRLMHCVLLMKRRISTNSFGQTVNEMRWIMTSLFVGLQMKLINIIIIIIVVIRRYKWTNWWNLEAESKASVTIFFKQMSPFDIFFNIFFFHFYLIIVNNKLLSIVVSMYFDGNEFSSPHEIHRKQNMIAFEMFAISIFILISLKLFVPSDKSIRTNRWNYI